MARLLFAVKDLHFRFGFKPPAGRTDDFEMQIFRKIDHLLDLRAVYEERGNEILGLLLTGDNTDIKSDSAYGFKSTRLNLNAFQLLKDEFGTLFSVAGNHDLNFSSRAYKDESFYSFLVERKLIDDIAYPKSSVELLKGNSVSLTGVDYTPDIDDMFEELNEALSLDEHKHRIVVVHEHLVPTDNDLLPFGKSITYKDFLKRLKYPVDIVVAGHLHKGFPLSKVGNTTFINVWNFTRLARDYYSVSGQHIPQVAIINLDDMSVIVEDIPHETFKKAFIEKELQAENTLTQNISEFIHAVSKVQNDTNATLSNIPEHIKSRVENYLQLAAESISK